MPQRRSARPILVAALLLSVTAVKGADAPAPRPVVPALTTEPNGRTSFLVSGVYRQSESGGVGFQVACDGKVDVCCVYDAADGTPLYLSDGRQTLVYDFLNFRVVRAESSRAYVGFRWHAGKERPLEFGVGVGFAANPADLTTMGPALRVDQFVRASADALRVVQDDGKIVVFAAERPGGAVDAIRQSPADPTWFSYSSARPGKEFYSLDLTARHIGRRLPAREVPTFPDLEKLRREMNIVDIDPRHAKEFIEDHTKAPAWLVKLALASGDGSIRQAAEKALPALDWERLRRRDEVLGKLYRDALAKQGIRFALARNDANAATPPATSTP